MTNRAPSSAAPAVGRRHVAALDLGTSSVRCFVVDGSGVVAGSARAGIEVLIPGPGLEELDPEQVWDKSVRVIRDAIADAGLTAKDILGLGICTQRGTFVTWDRKTGKHFHNFITWRDLRAGQVADDVNNSWTLKAVKFGGNIMRWLTGMPKFIVASILRFRSNYGAVALAYMLKNNRDLNTAVSEHRACFGSVDSYLLHRFTSGKVHAMDFSCAGSTAIFDLFVLKWSDLVFKLLQLPKHIFPPVLPTAHNFGETAESLFGAQIPICCLVGDQSASLFGSCSFDVGDVKLTLGTGGFLNVNTGTKPYGNLCGIYPICAWKIGQEALIYAAEGSNKDTGTVIEWAVAAGLASDPSETEDLAKSVPDSTSERLFFVPAFNGLEAPVQDSQAAAGFIGLLPYMKPAHMVRAILDSIAYRCYQLCNVMEKEGEGYYINTIKVDGGVSRNGYIMQLLADLHGKKLICSQDADLTALGTAYLVGLHTGLWKSQDELRKFYKPGRIYEPNAGDGARVQRNYARWEGAVRRFGSWYGGAERDEALALVGSSTSASEAVERMASPVGAATGPGNEPVRQSYSPTSSVSSGTDEPSPATAPDFDDGCPETAIAAAAGVDRQLFIKVGKALS